MITIRATEGTATYYLDPYPHWDGDEEMAERGEALRRQVDAEMVAHGLDPEANDRSQQLRRAFELACRTSGITVVEFVLPPLDPPFDPMVVR